jgi:hypothetical protein
MRAWVLWQIGIAYQSIDRKKALDLFQSALVIARAFGEDGAVERQGNDMLVRITGRPALSPGARLQADIARPIVLLEPKRADQVIRKVNPTARGPVLAAMLSQQENEKQFNKALETLRRLAAEDEMPYGAATRVMDALKPEQSGELIQLFLVALESYRDHAPHSQLMDEFPAMLVHLWKRLPRDAAQQAVDEILKQAAEADEKVNFSTPSADGTATTNLLYEYRLLQVMPMLGEFDPSAARSYREKYPALASGNPPDFISPPAPGAAPFRPSAGYSIMLGAAETPAAQKAATAADAGHGDEAMSQAASIPDLNLRAQTYEHIARVSAKKQASTAAKAIERMLDAAGKLLPDEAFAFYVSAARIYEEMDEMGDAKKSIETGLGVADKVLRADSDDDDPNTALKAFWPSTNAYCELLREAARISPAWAISLLQTIEDPEVRVSAETALAGGWLGAPIGPSTMMTAKKGNNSTFLSGRE